MNNLKLSRPVVVAIGCVFAALLVAAFWWKLNPTVDQRTYYRDAARLQAADGEQAPAPQSADGAAPVPARPNDKAYQREFGE